MLVLGEHGLIDAAVEAAKLEPHSWQAAKLRSVGGALGGLRSAAAALCVQLASEELPRRRYTQLLICYYLQKSNT